MNSKNIGRSCFIEYLTAIFLVFSLSHNSLASTTVLNLFGRGGEVYVGELNQNITSGGVTNGLAIFAYNKRSYNLVAAHLPYKETTKERVETILRKAVENLGLGETFFYIFGLSDFTMPNEDLKQWLGPFMQQSLGVKYWQIQTRWLSDSREGALIGSLTFFKHSHGDKLAQKAFSYIERDNQGNVYFDDFPYFPGEFPEKSDSGNCDQSLGI